MFINKQPIENINEYMEMLRTVGSLSNLFSENNKPYLDYRVAENLFCICLDAKNLSRSDCSADASKDKIGVGIKTFLNAGSNNSLQKIAEFNKQRSEYAGLRPVELVERVVHLRNERINVTKKLHGLDDMIYHCLIRDVGKIHIVESKLETIQHPVSGVMGKELVEGKNTIAFIDGNNEYSFNVSKSVLYKRFHTDNILFTIDVDILANPYELLRELIKDHSPWETKQPKETKPHVFLPLYSMRGGIKKVPEKSGLNQWNAGGRARNENELYVPIPVSVHRKMPDFFPRRDQPFNLELPDGTIISAKVCQDGNKALMSNPNYELGRWLLRHVMGIKEGELVTYEKLTELGIDSVILTKVDTENYSIDFTTAGKYEAFMGKDIFDD